MLVRSSGRMVDACEMDSFVVEKCLTKEFSSCLPPIWLCLISKLVAFLSYFLLFIGIVGAVLADLRISACDLLRFIIE